MEIPVQSDSAIKSCIPTCLLIFKKISKDANGGDDYVFLRTLQ